MTTQNKNVPALRFPEFNGDWEEKSLREISTLITKGTTPNSFSKAGINYVKIECLLNDSIDSNKCLFIDEKTHNKELKRSILKQGDLLFAIAGATIGKCGIVSSEILPANTNQALAIIRLRENEDLKFVFLNLQSPKMKRYIKETISVGAQPNLNLEQMGNFSFFHPSYNEQKKIAAFLVAVNEKIQQLAKKKALLEQYKKGMIQKIFNQEIRFKDDNGNDFADWEEKTLGELCKITTGKLDANAMKEDGEYRFYTCAKDYFRIDKFAFDTEALLISGNGANVGYIHYYNGKFNAYQRTYVLDKFSSNIIYTKYFLEKFLSLRIDKEKNEGNTPYIVLGTLRDMKINLPKNPEQRKIADFFSAIDDKINLVSQQLEKTQTFKKGLLQQMFI